MLRKFKKFTKSVMATFVKAFNEVKAAIKEFFEPVEDAVKAASLAVNVGLVSPQTVTTAAHQVAEAITSKCVAAKLGAEVQVVAAKVAPIAKAVHATKVVAVCTKISAASAVSLGMSIVAGGVVVAGLGLVRLIAKHRRKITKALSSIDGFVSEVSEFFSTVIEWMVPATT